MRKPEDVTLTEFGLAASFECELTKAGVGVVWTKGGKPIKKDQEHDMKSDGAVHRLTINKVKDTDLKDYTVHIVDKDKSATAKLVVSGACLFVYIST